MLRSTGYMCPCVLEGDFAECFAVLIDGKLISSIRDTKHFRITSEASWAVTKADFDLIQETEICFM